MISRRLGSLLLGACILIGVAAGRARSQEKPAAGITVFAAASLTDVLHQAEAAWIKKGGAPLTYSFDSSSRLAKQLESGAPADVFISADAEWMDYAVNKNAVSPSARKNLYGNRLVFIVPAGAAAVPQGAEDIVKLARIGVAGPNVPAGKYAREALGKLGVWPKLEGKTVDGDNVRTVLAWAARGEVDGAVVYLTDARADPKVRVAFEFDPSTHKPIVYPGSVVLTSTHKETALNYLDFLSGKEAREIFYQAGFSPLPEPGRP